MQPELCGWTAVANSRSLGTVELHRSSHRGSIWIPRLWNSPPLPPDPPHPVRSAGGHGRLLPPPSHPHPPTPLENASRFPQPSVPCGGGPYTWAESPKLSTEPGQLQFTFFWPGHPSSAKYQRCIGGSGGDPTVDMRRDCTDDGPVHQGNCFLSGNRCFLV